MQYFVYSFINSKELSCVCVCVDVSQYVCVLRCVCVSLRFYRTFSAK